MNYKFHLEEWLPRCPLRDDENGCYSAEIITSPSSLCNNEWLRRRMRNQFDWGEPVPMDVFVFSFGEPENRFATKIGGLPYRPADVPWPNTERGQSMALVAQFNFVNSKDLVGDLPGDLLLVFGDNTLGNPIEPLHFEWANLGLSNLISKLPEDVVPISPCFGHLCRTVSFPGAIPFDSKQGELSRCDGKVVWSSFWILQYQATQIGRAPFLVNAWNDDLPGLPLCTISSVQPNEHKPFPWVNHPEPLLPPDVWFPPDNDSYLMIGDAGCIYIYIDDDGGIHAHDSYY